MLCSADIQRGIDPGKGILIINPDRLLLFQVGFAKQRNIEHGKNPQPYLAELPKAN